MIGGFVSWGYGPGNSYLPVREANSHALENVGRRGGGRGAMVGWQSWNSSNVPLGAFPCSDPQSHMVDPAGSLRVASWRSGQLLFWAKVSHLQSIGLFEKPTAQLYHLKICDSTLVCLTLLEGVGTLNYQAPLWIGEDRNSPTWHL